MTKPKRVTAESRARVVACPKCQAPADTPCTGSGRAHRVRHDAYAVYVREAYCANEMMSGYPCGVQGCRSCGGAKS